MGGAIFVMDGGSLRALGGITVIGNAVIAGAHTGSAHDGSAFGSGLFLNGNGTIRFTPANGQTENVFNAIADEAGVVANGYTPPSGFLPGSYSLIKSGLGTLVLRAHNDYSGGTTLKAGTLDLAAAGAAGTGAITFGGHATLKIENAALPGQVFGNQIEFFAKSDAFDLSGLKFHSGAKAKYDPVTNDLTVHSGHFTDTLSVLSPHGPHFTVANDGRGGTLVTLDAPHLAATVASMSPHDLGGQTSATDGASHPGDFLIVA
jgi:autotransporter-associated beta strand protein